MRQGNSAACSYLTTKEELEVSLQIMFVLLCVCVRYLETRDAIRRPEDIINYTAACVFVHKHRGVSIETVII